MSFFAENAAILELTQVQGNSLQGLRPESLLDVAIMRQR